MSSAGASSPANSGMQPLSISAAYSSSARSPAIVATGVLSKVERASLTTSQAASFASTSACVTLRPFCLA